MDVYIKQPDGNWDTCVTQYLFVGVHDIIRDLNLLFFQNAAKLGQEAAKLSQDETVARFEIQFFDEADCLDKNVCALLVDKKLNTRSPAFTPNWYKGIINTYNYMC